MGLKGFTTEGSECHLHENCGTNDAFVSMINSFSFVSVTVFPSTRSQ